MSFGAPPVIPTELQQYNSYATDPRWARKFTIIWCSTMGFFLALYVPALFRVLRRSPGRILDSLGGISEDFVGEYGQIELSGKGKEALSTRGRSRAPIRPKNVVVASLGRIVSLFRWTVPGAEINFGQMLLIAGYLVAVLACATMNVPLIDNPNRLGFLAVAQLPPVFLFATKNNAFSLLSGFSSFSYEKLNFIHKWAGRGLFICATAHGALWIRNHLVYDLPILGEYKETSGVAAYGVLCVIVLTSIRPIRRLAYQFFFMVHILGYVAFFITLCYHTPYATPWIFPPLAFYAFDLALRMLRYRVKDAVLIPVDKNMTLIHVRDCDAGWKAGQHVRLRVFFSGRIFESHPLTIINAPSKLSCASEQEGTLTLAARVSGDWTRSLNRYASEEQERLLGQVSCCEDEKGGKAGPEVEVQVMLDGPYGGCSIDVASYETVLLVAGGSGATFTLGMLDDLLGRVVKDGRKEGERTMRVEFVWCIRSFGCIEWFAPQLQRLAHAAANSDLDLHISIYVTCLCNPEAVPPIPNSDVSIYRPSVGKVLEDLLTPPSSAPLSTPDIEDQRIGEKLKWIGLGGGVAVCASGPESLIRETENAVASLGLRKGRELGGVGLHTELFAI